ncbi:hypothetical protein FNH22_04325 [Fulvivirga sp. M361]|uniref:hypothetical protein n=1 Tax=Fulvivirga sp. M361 TaxID=2594266 RepID=UPI00117AF073|nr:hypothetical protein [Fulvivirga sp. M361]TRX61288.1 hypothetical protein FNH22_04325 [Fulvivirga sp. M361]
MRRRIVVLGASIFSATLSFSQVKKQFSVDSNEKIEQIDLDFKVNSGSCFIKGGEGKELLNVYSNLQYDDYGHSFQKSINNKVCKINLALEDVKSEGLSQSISYRMFGRSDDEKENIWKVYLSEDKTYNLNLDYGVGTADIDLSGLSIEKLKVRTGSADVNIGYFENLNNPVPMDTFYVKVDLGSVSVKKVNLSKAKNVVADIGFGNLMLDFTDKSQVSSNIKGSVGAGNLMILLPKNGTPIKVTINDSWLCKVKLTKSFKRLSNNTYVNADYSENADNLLNFDLDVSMGSIVFKEQQ